jgi:hypothetical protein
VAAVAAIGGDVLQPALSSGRLGSGEFSQRAPPRARTAPQLHQRAADLDRTTQLLAGAVELERAGGRSEARR